MAEPAAVAQGPCRNCGQALGTPRPKFCGACGQETDWKPPTLMEFIQQFGGNYVAAEGALWRTLGLLLFRPGRLTQQYLAGRKKRYVLPLRLYLTISLLALLALRMSGTLQPADENKVMLKFDKPLESMTLIDIGDTRVGMFDGQFVCTQFPQVWCQRLQERITLDPKSMAREMRQLPDRFVSHFGSAMFALLPLFAAMLKVVYWCRHMRWSEHLVFALHLHAFWFAMLLTQLSGVGWMQAAAAFAVPVYSLRAAHVVYGGRWWGTVLRGFALSLIYVVTVAVAMVAVAVWALVT